MRIRKISINNFRIYNGNNTIIFPDGDTRNVCIISGNNGSGKTTLLTALVWCLYGNQIQDVDESFKDRVNTVGSYKNYLQSCMNKKALENNESEYYVSIDFTGVKLPGISCDTIQIKRSFNVNKTIDILQISMDGNPNELVDDIGQQLFIQDFILPKELAKLFFFDAEKIVKLAEVQSLHEKRLIGRAYTEVLGIKKFEDLRNNLSELMVRFRKDSASEEEKKQFETLSKEIYQIEHTIEDKERKQEQLINRRLELRIQVDELQEKLIREGSYLSVSEIDGLKEKKSKLIEKQNRLKNDFKELFEFAPFAIMGHLMINIKDQIEKEEHYNCSIIDQETLINKIRLIIDDILNDKSIKAKNIPDDIKKYYSSKVNKLANKYLIDENNLPQEKIEILHNFNIEDSNRFKAILADLKTTYKDKLRNISSELKTNKIELDNISRKIDNAELKEEDSLIKEIRHKRNDVEEQIVQIDSDTLKLSQDIGALENELSTKNRIFSEITKRMKVNNTYINKDKLVKRLTEELSDFINKLKLYKKTTLEEKILFNIQLLMHKKNYINNVTIEFQNDMLDVLLFDDKGKEIKKEDLSKGEQQLYASALLKSLVEESRIKFPVVVDSPLQKFDNIHSKNIITKFYPKISSQVVILPLMHKELSAQEYNLLIEHVGCSYVIENKSGISSSFREINLEETMINAQR